MKIHEIQVDSIVLNESDVADIFTTGNEGQQAAILVEIARQVKEWKGPWATQCDAIAGAILKNEEWKKEQWKVAWMLRTLLEFIES